MAEWLFEPLANDHDRKAFSCGRPSLDGFLHKQAGQYTRKNIGRTFVAVRPDSRVVIGYYTLAASSIEMADLPPELTKQLPEHPVPTILLGRLAVDVSAHGKGLGKDLLWDALSRAMQIGGEVGVFAVHVHAIDDAAANFYTKYGFQPIPDQERHMILPMSTIRKSLDKARKK